MRSGQLLLTLALALAAASARAEDAAPAQPPASGVEQSKRAVLEFLTGIGGKQTVAGMHNREPNSVPALQTSAIHELTGKYPGLWSGDFLFKADDVNARHAGRGAPPIVLLVEHHEADAVYEYYRAADLCFVSSLHDGMNLVAKEFVSARDDERGVLILSQFTGAARALPEALIVNPYDADQCASALHLGLTMPAEDQRVRMRLMRNIVREFNVYRWAGRMLLDAASMRQRNRFRDRTEATAP